MKSGVSVFTVIVVAIAVGVAAFYIGRNTYATCIFGHCVALVR